MATNQPTTIPEQFASHEALADAYRDGWNHGHGIACHNVPKLGEKYLLDSLGRVTADAENIREVHQSLCYEAEDHSRQFSPFEFTAHELNEAGDGDEENPSSEELWEAFDEGINDAIAADLAEYNDEDYGIAQEEESEG